MILAFYRQMKDRRAHGKNRGHNLGITKYIERERERERKTNPKTIPNPKCNPSGCGQTLSVPLAQSKKPFEE